MSRTQANRQAELITPLGTDKLLFHHMVAQEGVSELFDYDLLVLSEDANIVLSDLVGQHAHVELELPNDATRYFCGHVTRFTFLGYHGNLAKYMLKMRPWLWFLSQSRNCRIFQKMSVPEIIKAVCASPYGFTDIDDRLTDTYDPREFCVQYRESDLAFISRLMEDEGIYYYFVHEAGKHELVLADGISAHATFGDYAIVPWYPPDSHDHRERDYLDHWELCQSVRSGQYETRDFNFEKPQNNLRTRAITERPIQHGSYEVYDYPGGYGAIQPGEKYARKRIEALQADFEVLNGAGNARGLQPGHLFTLENHDRADQNREYLILSVTHDISQDDYDSAPNSSDNSFNYGCSLQAMPSSEPFRPPRTTERPIVHGPQTAYVVGDSGEEIWTDQYGRVKVEFHWDRADQNNSNSSCWVRVSQNWAGKRWGAQFLPRIGHEVIVEFLEGDPDRPIITGSVYNKDNMPPYDLPTNATQSGIKTRSSKDGCAANYNEIRFEDKKGEEQLLFHAEKDMDITVENDRDEVVHNNETVEVKGNRTHTVGKDDTRNVKGNDAQTIDGRQNITIKDDRDLRVSGSVTENVTVHQTEVIGGVWANTSHGGINITSPTAPITITSGSAITLTAPNLNTSDNSVVSLTTFALGIAWSTNGIEAFHSDWRGISMGVTGLNVGLNGMNTGYTGVDITGTKVEVTKKDVKLLIEKLKLAKTMLTLKKNDLTLRTAQLALKKASLKIDS